MGLIRNVTDELKKNNRIYTEECRKIYEEIRFSKVQLITLYNALVPIIFSIITAFLLGVDIYYIIGLLKGDSFEAVHIVALIISGIFFGITVVITIYYIIQYRKKSEPRYFVKDTGGEFEIYCTGTVDGELTVSTIVHSTRHKILYLNGDKYTMESELDQASERNGFYEFLVPPDKVFSKNVCCLPIYSYKKKKVKGNVTFYYFLAFDKPMFGTRKPRSIKLVNGVVTSICRQVIYEMQGSSKTNNMTFKYEYSHVNDDDFKLHIPKFMQEEAIKLKFTLPLESANIIYDNE